MKNFIFIKTDLARNPKFLTHSRHDYHKSGILISNVNKPLKGRMFYQKQSLYSFRLTDENGC